MFTPRNAVEEHGMKILTREEFLKVMDSLVTREKFLIRYHGQDKLVYEVVGKI